jgi:predicted membrane-bound spermidine synthase
MILFLFFCSGATALVYEVVWSKYLSLIFGSTAYAQTVVLAVFMGGLALGNRIIGARSDLLQKPLVTYGFIEVMIGLYAFCFPLFYKAADALFTVTGSPLLDHSFALLLLKCVISIGLLLLPTVMMGGTLPLLSAWLQKQSNDAGRWSARFYSTNSLGAVFGAWVAGFVLIRSIGMASTLQMTALANVILGFTAVGIGRHVGAATESTRTSTTTSSLGAGESQSKTVFWVTAMVAITGGVSMGLEVLASRSLTLIFGASVQAFATVLMAFILGIGLGSAAAASPRLKRWRYESIIFTLLLIAAGAVGILVVGIEQWVEVYRHVRVGLARTEMGYRFYQIIAAGFSLVVLGLPAGLIGAVLPLCLRLISTPEGFGNRVGRLLTSNTLGAVVGVLITGFILMPGTGLRAAFFILALALCLAVFFLAWHFRKWAFFVSSSTVAVFLAISCIVGGEGWRHVLTSGVFRARETEVDPTMLDIRKKYLKIVYYKDGPDATVSVEKDADNELALRISGKPEASTKVDLPSQLIVAHLGMVMRPESKDVFILGLASGITCRGLLAYPIEHLTVAENCAPVLRAAEFFSDWNRGVLTNRVSNIRLEDGRTVLKLSRKPYDVIVSEPSNPWFASVGSVFSKEFYEIAASRLKPGGFMVQWFHTYEMQDSIVETVIRTFASVFPNMEIWDASYGDLVLLGSNQPWDSSPARLRKAYEIDLVRKDLNSIGLGTPEAFWARRFASQRTAPFIAGPGPIQSDVFPMLEYDAPLAFYIGANARRLMRFDERTWQATLASPETSAAVSKLDLKTLAAIFENVSLNPDVQRGIKLRQECSNKDASKSSKLELTATPFIFDPAGSRMGDHLPSDADANLKALFHARDVLRTQPDGWAKQVQTIKTILLSEFVPNAPVQSQPFHAQFAAEAARVALNHREFELANEMILLGATFAPAEPEFPYLLRLVQNERDLQPKRLLSKISE